MFNIKKYLEKFSQNISGVENQKKQILVIIEKYTQTNHTSKDIEIKNYVIYLKSSPVIKNKVFIFKNKILEEISSSIPSLKIIDIK